MIQSQIPNGKLKLKGGIILEGGKSSGRIGPTGRGVSEGAERVRVQKKKNRRNHIVQREFGGKSPLVFLRRGESFTGGNDKSRAQGRKIL